MTAKHMHTVHSVLPDGSRFRDLSTLASRSLLEGERHVDDLADAAYAPDIGPLGNCQSRQPRQVLVPAEFQSIKAAGVTIAGGIHGPVIEKQAKGGPSRIRIIREKLASVIGDAGAKRPQWSFGTRAYPQLQSRKLLDRV